MPLIFRTALLRVSVCEKVALCYCPSLAAYLLASSSRSPLMQHTAFSLAPLERLDTTALARHVSVQTYLLVREALLAVQRARELQRRWRQLQQHRQYVLQRPVSEDSDQQLRELRAAIVEAQSNCHQLQVDEPEDGSL